MRSLIHQYRESLEKSLKEADWQPVEELAASLLDAIRDKRQVFICGNGGSAGNAMHLANDFLYGICPNGQTMRIEALPANASVITCLSNDIGYENIFSHQLGVKADAGDILIVLSGSGNSPNILNALSVARELGMKSFAILGFSGGKAKTCADVAIHFPVDNMQISEDLQLIVGHMLMQHLRSELRHDG